LGLPIREYYVELYSNALSAFLNSSNLDEKEKDELAPLWQLEQHQQDELRYLYHELNKFSPTAFRIMETHLESPKTRNLFREWISIIVQGLHGSDMSDKWQVIRKFEGLLSKYKSIARVIPNIEEVFSSEEDEDQLDEYSIGDEEYQEDEDIDDEEEEYDDDRPIIEDDEYMNVYI
jgi:hypothetical protein